MDVVVTSLELGVVTDSVMPFLPLELGEMMTTGMLYLVWRGYIRGICWRFSGWVGLTEKGGVV